MACTHYPLLAKVIAETMGEGITLVNTGEAAASVVREMLSKDGKTAEGTGAPKREFYTSDEPLMFENVAAPFLGEGLPSGTGHFSTDRYDVEI